MQARPHLSIVIPAYNEAPRIRGSLDRLIPFFRSERMRPPASSNS
jgi:glycosyltransferase involved in cell wall biosynthesis